MSTTPDSGIVKDSGPLSEEYLPRSFPVRQDLVDQVVDHAATSTLWLHGPAGSGKTATVRLALGQLELAHVRTAYVNCWSAQTFHAVLEAVLDELRVLVGDLRDVSFRYERFARAARQQRLVIALDEVDQMFPRERNATLYNLSRTVNVGLICLAQDRSGFLGLDSRVRSRLRPRFLAVPGFTPGDLATILRQRAQAGLVPSSWCEADLARIASASEGDARIAIQTLRTAAFLSEKERSPQLLPSAIDQGLVASSQLRREYHLRGLSDHHRLLYRIVRDQEAVAAVELWTLYRKLAPKEGLEPMARRTFNHYKQYLLASRFLREKQGRGRRNKRVLEVVE